MTTLSQTITSLWKTALKERSPTKDVLSSIRTEVKNRVIATRTTGASDVDPPDDLVLDVLRKMLKQRKESVEEYVKGNRKDLADKESFELSVIESFLPKQLSPEALTAIVKEAVTETNSSTVKDLGKVMKLAMAKVAGQADGKEVQAAVKVALGA